MTASGSFFVLGQNGTERNYSEHTKREKCDDADVEVRRNALWI